MPIGKRKKIIRLLGVGFDAEDGHVRISRGEKYDVLMGSEESHEYIRKLIQDIEKAIEERGLSLDDLTPEEFTELVGSLRS
jgi:phosphopantothenate synthetase